jgi:hypothetical protein
LDAFSQAQAFDEIVALDHTKDEKLAPRGNSTMEGDRPFSPRIRTLSAILQKLKPEPVREPLPPPKVYAPPRALARRRRADR